MVAQLLVNGGHWDRTLLILQEVAIICRLHLNLQICNTTKPHCCFNSIDIVRARASGKWFIATEFDVWMDKFMSNYVELVRQIEGKFTTKIPNLRTQKYSFTYLASFTHLLEAYSISTYTYILAIEHCNCDILASYRLLRGRIPSMVSHCTKLI